MKRKAREEVYGASREVMEVVGVTEEDDTGDGETYLGRSAVSTPKGSNQKRFVQTQNHTLFCFLPQTLTFKFNQHHVKLEVS